jgi:restriction endonuclease
MAALTGTVAKHEHDLEQDKERRAVQGLKQVVEQRWGATFKDKVAEELHAPAVHNTWLQQQ